jgi:Mn2+/Fe2+ NRAMP family transporter
MGEYVNTLGYNIVAWVTAIAMIVLTLFVSYAAFFQQGPSPGG